MNRDERAKEMVMEINDLAIYNGLPYMIDITVSEVFCDSADGVVFGWIDLADQDRDLARGTARRKVRPVECLRYSENGQLVWLVELVGE